MAAESTSSQFPPVRTNERAIIGVRRSIRPCHRGELMRKAPTFARPAALLLAAVLGLCACQGTNQNFQSQQPRSREAGELEVLPPDQKTQSRKSIDGSGGQVEYG